MSSRARKGCFCHTLYSQGGNPGIFTGEIIGISMSCRAILEPVTEDTGETVLMNPGYAKSGIVKTPVSEFL